MSADSATPVPTDQEFQLFQQLIQQKLGIFLPAQKKALLSNRLWKRLQACNLKGFGEYYRFIQSPQGRGELSTALELITTNETYFFREQKHFDYLQEEILPKFRPGQNFRVWSAASSTGEEPYSIAMVLKDRCSCDWELLCSDVNRTVVEQAKIGIYPDMRVRNIPPEYLRRFCRKGIGPQTGNVRVIAELRQALPQLPPAQHAENADEANSTSHFSRIFGQFIRIRRDDDGGRFAHNDPLFARALLDANLRDAQAALLIRDAARWQQALNGAKAQLAHDFDGASPEVAKAQTTLESLAKTAIAPAAPNVLGAALKELRNLRATHSLQTAPAKPGAPAEGQP